MAKRFLVRETTDPLKVNLVGIGKQNEEPPVLASAALKADRTGFKITIGEKKLGGFFSPAPDRAILVDWFSEERLTYKERGMALTLLSVIALKQAIHYTGNPVLQNTYIKEANAFCEAAAKELSRNTGAELA